MQGYTLTLKEMRDVADGTRLFIFDKPEGYVFEAGQYVAMEVPMIEGIDLDKRGLIRSLSIASAPCESELFFSMRRSMSSFKQVCWAMTPGMTVTITKAVGFFTVPKDNQKPIIFLVGGIGVTPVRSILKQAEYEKSVRDFTFFYSNRFTKDAAFNEEMKNIKLDHFRYVTVLSKSTDACSEMNDERGYICADMLKKYIKDVSDSLYYIVGSPYFSEAIEKMLADLGVSKENCHMDPFTGIQAGGTEQK